MPHLDCTRCAAEGELSWSEINAAVGMSGWRINQASKVRAAVRAAVPAASCPLHAAPPPSLLGVREGCSQAGVSHPRATTLNCVVNFLPLQISPEIEELTAQMEGIFRRVLPDDQFGLAEMPEVGF